MNKGVWFLAGSALGAYGVTRVRRAAEALSYDGVGDRLSGLFVGARLFAFEVKAGAKRKDAELRERLDLMGDEPASLLLEGQQLKLVRGSED